MAGDSAHVACPLSQSFHFPLVPILITHYEKVQSCANFAFHPVGLPANLQPASVPKRSAQPKSDSLMSDDLGLPPPYASIL